MLQFKISGAVSSGKFNTLSIDFKIKKFLVVFKKIRENHKKVTQKREFHSKPVFEKIYFFILLELKNKSL